LNANSTRFYLAELILLGAIWGASFLFMRVAAPDFGPLALIFLRTFIAALALLPLVCFNGEHRIIFRHALLFLWLGAVTVALPFTLFAYVTLHITAGTASILNATASMFSAVIAWVWLNERLNVWASAGVAVGFVGVFILSFGRAANHAGLHLPSVGAALVATSLYAYGSCFARKHLHAFRARTIAAGSQFGSALLLFPLAWYYWPAQMPGARSWLCSVLLGVFCTAFALIIYFDLIKKVGVARTVSVTYLIPVFGILWGALFLGEAIQFNMLAGGVLVLLGVAFTNKK
jgi:drug/metabolite transporter (DMT)-like permease